MLKPTPSPEGPTVLIVSCFAVGCLAFVGFALGIAWVAARAIGKIVR